MICLKIQCGELTKPFYGTNYAEETLLWLQRATEANYPPDGIYFIMSHTLTASS